MKKVLSIALLALLALTLCVGCQPKADANKLEKILAEGKITMATSPDFAPMEFMDPTKTGQEAYVGSDVQLGRYIAEKLGVELVIEAMDFTAVQAAVTQGDIDMGISGFAYTEERAESMLLSDFFNMGDDDGQGLLVRVGEADQYTSAESFAGKTVAVQNASLQYNLATKQLPSDVKFEIISNLNDAVMMLITNKVDAVAVSGDNGISFAENYSDIVMCAFYFDYTSEGNVLGVTKGEDELIAKINEILAEVNEKGLYKQWLADAKALAATLGVDVD